MRKKIRLVLFLMVIGALSISVGWLLLQDRAIQDQAKGAITPSDSEAQAGSDKDPASIALNANGKAQIRSMKEDSPTISNQRIHKPSRSYVTPNTDDYLPSALYTEFSQAKKFDNDSVQLIYFELLSRCRELEVQRAILKNEKDDSPSSILESDCRSLHRDAYKLGDAIMRQMLDRRDWRARYLYAMGYFTPFRGVDDIIRNPDQYNSYKHETIQILNDLIDEGSVQAIYRMAHLYKSGWFDQDPITANAYLYAGARAEGDFGKMNSIESIVSEKLDRESQQIFRVLSASIYNRCCAN